MRWVMAAILAAAICGGAKAASDPCAIRAFAVGEDLHEINIRLDHSEESLLLAAVPSEYAELELREERDGWFRVAAIEDAVSGEPLFAGTGWVRGSVLALSISGGGNRTLYADPSEDGRAVLTGLGGGETPELVGCAGDWARVRLGDQTGWLAPSGQCSSALTTCN